MHALTEPDLQAEVQTYEFKPYYYPTLFPLKETANLTWKTLQAKVGLKIAADLVARGARVDKKARNAINKIMGDIPKIAIKRTMDEEELTDYDIMVAQHSNDPDLRALIEAWAEDTKFCFDGVNNRIEWMALHMISHAGKLSVTSENNAHIISEYDADYEIPAEQKKGTAVAWTNAATAKPVSVDLKNIVKAARKEGHSLKYCFMNVDTFNAFVEIEEVQKVCASYVANALDMQQIPDLNAVNNAFKKLPYLYGLQIVVIDQEISVELPDGTLLPSANPFVSNVCAFTESTTLGNTFYKIPIDMKVEGTAAIKALNGPVCIKKFGNEEPIEEVTMGIANACPAWAGSERCWFLDTKNASWNEGK